MQAHYYDCEGDVHTFDETVLKSDLIPRNHLFKTFCESSLTGTFSSSNHDCIHLAMD